MQRGKQLRTTSVAGSIEVSLPAEWTTQPMQARDPGARERVLAREDRAPLGRVPAGLKRRSRIPSSAIRPTRTLVGGRTRREGCRSSRASEVVASGGRASPRASMCTDSKRTGRRMVLAPPPAQLGPAARIRPRRSRWTASEDSSPPAPSRPEPLVGQPFSRARTPPLEEIAGCRDARRSRRSPPCTARADAGGAPRRGVERGPRAAPPAAQWRAPGAEARVIEGAGPERLVAGRRRWAARGPFGRHETRGDPLPSGSCQSAWRRQPLLDAAFVVEGGGRRRRPRSPPSGAARTPRRIRRRGPRRRSGSRGCGPRSGPRGPGHDRSTARSRRRTRGPSASRSRRRARRRRRRHPRVTGSSPRGGAHLREAPRAVEGGRVESLPDDGTRRSGVDRSPAVILRGDHQVPAVPVDVADEERSRPDRRSSVGEGHAHLEVVEEGSAPRRPDRGDRGEPRRREPPGGCCSRSGGPGSRRRRRRRGPRRGWITEAPVGVRDPEQGGPGGS